MPRACRSDTAKTVLQGTDVEVFLSQPGLVQTPLNGRKLDHSKLVAMGVDIATKVYGQSAERASLCLQRPATDPDVTGRPLPTFCLMPQVTMTREGEFYESTTMTRHGNHVALVCEVCAVQGMP